MSYLNDFIKPSDYGAVRKDINRILSLIHDITAQEPEDEGLQERICISSNVKLRTTSVVFGAANLLGLNYKDRFSSIFRKVIPTTVYTYDLTHTTTGSLTFTSNDTKFGGAGTFDGSSYITITDHDRMDTSNVSLGGWFYLPATDASDVSAQNLMGKGSSFQLTIDPHATAANQLRVKVNDPVLSDLLTETGVTVQTEDSLDLEVISEDITYSNFLNEAGVTVQTEDLRDLEFGEFGTTSVVGTFIPDAWNHIIMTRGAVNLKLYINNVLVSTDTSMDGNMVSNTSDLIIG
jgi:hypothetical protein